MFVNKSIYLLVIGICLSFIGNAQVSKSVITTAGRLAAALTTAELQTVTDLAITGTIDARDFKAMRDDMPLLAVLDLSEVTITAYSGVNGTFSLGNFDFPADEVPYSAFYDSNSVGKYSLTSVVLPKSINSIGKFAFRDCIGITSFIIPGVINSIGDYAFGSCRGLTSFDIPEGTKYIGVLAFEDCSQMTNLKIPSTVRAIGDGAFMSFNGMIVVDANNLKYSSKDWVLFNKNQTALLQCPISKKGNYIIPASVTSIGTYAFYACNKLTSITIPTLVTTIGKEAFVRCTEITSLTIPSSVNSVGPQAFWGCINLLSITSQGVNPCSFGSSFEVFGEVDNTSCILYIPYGTASLYKNASQWQDFTNIIEKTGFYLSATTANIESATGSDAKIDVSANVVWTASSDQTWLTVSPLNGTGIGQKLTFTADANPLFTERIAKVTVSAPGVESQAITITQNKQSSIKNYKVTPGSISTLSSYELNNITSLTLTGTIDARDFKTIRDKMPLLAVLDIGGVSIAEYIGSDGTSIWNNSNYPANTIPESAFMDGNWKGKTGLTSIVLPSSMTAFGLYSFGNCSGVTAISIPPSVTNLGSNVFNGCAGLTSVIIPSSVTNTGNSTFAGCKSLTSVNIPSSIITIGELTFGSCIGLTSITIPASVDTIRSSAFTGCTGLTSISIPSSITSMGSYVFSGCSGLKSFSFPPSVTKIESNTFSKCNGLSEITIPSWITTIGEAAFNECKGLTSVTILSPKTTLGNWAFGNCTKLSSLTVPWIVPPGLEDYTLSAVNRNTCNLYVPFGTAKLYAADVQWGTFMHIIEYGTGFSLSTNTSKVESAARSTSTIEVTANINWTANSDQTWLIVSPLNGTGIGQKLTFTADANPLFTSRTATVEVSATGLEPQFVTVTQNTKQDIPVNPGDSTNVGNDDWNDHNLIKNWNFTTDLTYWGGWWDGATQIPPVIQDGVAVMHTDVNADGNNWHYQLNQSGLKAEANVPYILKFKAWSSTARSNGLVFEDTPANSYNRYGTSSDPEAINGRSEWIYYTTTEPSWFTFHVTFDQMNPTTVQKIQWMLSTANATAYLDSVLLTKDDDLVTGNPAYLTLDLTQVNMPDIETSATANISSNTKWAASTDQTWLTVSPSTGSENGTLIITAEGNSLVTSRNALITVSASGMDPKTILITQNGKEEPTSEPGDSTQVVVSATQVNLTAKESNAKIDISSNSTCTAISDQSWLIVSPMNGPGSQTLNLTIEANQTGANRSATITIYVSGVASQSITITQESVTGTDPIIDNQKMMAYPNPTTGKVKLVFDHLPDDGTLLYINDLNGKTILKQFIRNKEEYIDLKGNTPGIYIIKTNMKDFKVQKVILK